MELSSSRSALLRRYEIADDLARAAAQFFQTVEHLARMQQRTIATMAMRHKSVQPILESLQHEDSVRIERRSRSDPWLLQDMIMTIPFEWMDVYGYKFKEDFTVRLIGLFGRLSSCG